jgi:hypothetical protein
MTCVARVLSLSHVKIGEKNLVRCGLKVISVSVGLRDMNPGCMVGLLEEEF